MVWSLAGASPVVKGEHPFINGRAFQGPEGVVFLAGVFTDLFPADPFVVEITIPAETPRFFPILNVECSVAEPENEEGDDFHGDNEAELRECANDHIDHTSDRFAFIDGTKVKNLHDFRTESPLFEWGPLPGKNILGLKPGTKSDAVDAGYYLFLAPLSVGEHSVEFGGTFHFDFGEGHVAFSINTKYIINVESDGD